MLDHHDDDPDHDHEGPAGGPDAEGPPRSTATEPCPELGAEAWGAFLEEDARAMSAQALGRDLEHALLRRLAEAWADLNWQYLRGQLRPPSIQLHDGERRWGAWHKDKRLITISRRQVLCYTWASVLETLRHEMAHQVVSEVMFRDVERPHGQAFAEACKRLACDPAASGGGGASLFRPGGVGPRAAEEDARLLRIQKLLALADNNPDEHEARAAFARASELMLKYNLEPGAAARQGGYVWRHLGEPSGRTPHHRYVIAGLLQEFFFVRCIWVDTFVVSTAARGHVLEVMGTRENVDMAEYVHDCLARQCEVQWLAFKEARGLRGIGAKREFLDGLLAGFRTTLQATTTESKERGLVWLGDAGLKRWSRTRHPRTTRTRLDGVYGSEIRDAGVEEGQRLRLHRPVRDGGGSGDAGGRLLPG